MPRSKPAVIVAALAACLLWFCIAWQLSFSKNSFAVVYFGRPYDIVQYAGNNSLLILQAAGLCLWTAIISLILAGGISTLLLALGLSTEGWLRRIERLAASSQTIPLLVIVAFTLSVETYLFKLLSISPWAWVYCVGPVTLGLLFPPLVNGAEAILRMRFEIKALLRIWQAPAWWRICRVYLPSALPDLLTGLRASSTWAVGATLVTEGLLHGVKGDSETLGHWLMRAFSSSTPPGRTLTVIILSTLLGFAVYQIFSTFQLWLQRHLLGNAVEAEEAYPIQSKRVVATYRREL